jgi:hypothetical protein
MRAVPSAQGSAVTDTPARGSHPVQPTRPAPAATTKRRRGRDREAAGTVQHGVGARTPWQRRLDARCRGRPLAARPVATTAPLVTDSSSGAARARPGEAPGTIRPARTAPEGRIASFDAIAAPAARLQPGGRRPTRDHDRVPAQLGHLVPRPRSKRPLPRTSTRAASACERRRRIGEHRQCFICHGWLSGGKGVCGSREFIRRARSTHPGASSKPAGRRRCGISMAATRACGRDGSRACRMRCDDRSDPHGPTPIGPGIWPTPSSRGPASMRRAICT